MGRSNGNTPDRCTKPLSSDERYRDLTESEFRAGVAYSAEKYVVGVVLLHGPPPPKPEGNDLEIFSHYLHDLAVWTNNARKSLIDMWGINDWTFENSRSFRYAFDRCIKEWHQGLEYKEISDES